MAKKQKFYVVCEGKEKGIFFSWEECKKKIENFANAKYKSFATQSEAENAFKCSPSEYIGKDATEKKSTSTTKPKIHALAVDAACSGNPGLVEYRGVMTDTGEQIFHNGPFEEGTNNIGEFLAIVHGLALLKQNNSTLALYSDSANAISWVKAKKCRTKLQETTKNKVLFDLIRRAEKWLATNEYRTQIVKWETAEWGEIPADFGRK